MHMAHQSEWTSIIQTSAWISAYESKRECDGGLAGSFVEWILVSNKLD